MRLTLLFLTLASPAAAWEFSPTPICTLTDSATATQVTVTYDHATSLYAINLTRPQGWPPAPVFVIRFDGPRGLTISTDRHQITADGQTLTVTDTGFGNVLNGLAFNTTATAMLGPTATTVPLTGATEPVEKFRACTEALAV